MTFGRELQHALGVGRVTASHARVWARSDRPGPHRIVIRRRGTPGAARTEDVSLSLDIDDGTGAWTLPRSGELEPDREYEVELWADGAHLRSAAFRTAPKSRDASPKRWSFGVVSCHQPFSPDGEVAAAAESMLRATLRAYQEADARFILMMGDQTYADLPRGHSLFDDAHFAQIAPPGRDSLLDCTAEEVRSIYQRRHRLFWGVPGFERLQARFACYPMPDDHEIVDNFGSHPDHATPKWDAIRAGALDAFFDYQGARVHCRDAGGARPAALDWGFSSGCAAVWGLDVRSNRRSESDHTRVYSDDQYDAFVSFLEAHAELPLLVLMTPIPLVHVEGLLIATASRVLGEGSDLHERWSHPRVREDRNRLLRAVIEHSRRNPHQRIVSVAGDVHAGAAFEIDFDGGVQMLQLTSSALTNREGWVVRAACKQAARSVDDIEIADDLRGSVNLLGGCSDAVARNPFGELNAGLVDVYDHGDRVGVGLRLISHDGEGNPTTVFDSGEVGRTVEPDRRVLGV